jgi:hypothetical protein
MPPIVSILPAGVPSCWTPESFCQIHKKTQRANRLTTDTVFAEAHNGCGGLRMETDGGLEPLFVIGQLAPLTEKVEQR